MDDVPADQLAASEINSNLVNRVDSSQVKNGKRILVSMQKN
jgi:hypothetical protein